MREFAYVNLSKYNRACFLNNIKNIFHNNPYYTTITAQDYLQLLILLCPDFPISIVESAIHFIASDNNDQTKEEMYQLYDIKDLQLSTALQLYYSEFFATPLMVQFKTSSMDMKEFFSYASKIVGSTPYILNQIAFT